MGWRFLSVICAVLVLWTQPSLAVVVDLSQVSDGEPVPGTTISLETLDGEPVELEFDVVEAETPDAGVVEQPVADAPATPADAPATGTPTATPVPDNTSDTSTDTANGEQADEGERRTATAVPVPGDGNVRFTVDDKYRNRPLVLVVRDGNGRVVEQRRVELTGTVASIAVSGLPFYSPAETARAIGVDGVTRPVVSDQPNGVIDQAGDDGEDNGRFQLTMEVEGGGLERDSFNALRLQNGATIVQDRFASVNRNGSFSSVMLQGQMDLGTPAPFFGTNLYAVGSFRYGYGSVDDRQTNVSSGGRSLGILAPEGPGGVLGGGVLVGAAFSDLNFVAYADNYHEYMAQLGLSTMVQRGPVMFTPRTLFFYGNTNESLYYSGRTNANTLDFGYGVHTNSHRVGVQVGTEIAVEVLDGVSLFAGADARLIQNFAETTASLDLSGALNHSEMVSADRNAFDLGGIFEGGLRVQRGRFSGSLGGRLETWQIPVAQITGEQPLFISFENRTSYTAFARFNIALGGPVNGPVD